jgi:hypothetical protein
VHDVEGGVERRGREDKNLLYLIEDEAVQLKKGLRGTCPEFRAWGKDSKVKEPVVPLPDFLLEEDGPHANPDTHDIIYLDDVISKRTR